MIIPVKFTCNKNYKDSVKVGPEVDRDITEWFRDSLKQVTVEDPANGNTSINQSGALTAWTWAWVFGTTLCVPEALVEIVSAKQKAYVTYRTHKVTRITEARTVFDTREEAENWVRVREPNSSSMYTYKVSEVEIGR